MFQSDCFLDEKLPGNLLDNPNFTPAEIKLDDWEEQGYTFISLLHFAD